MSIADKMGVGIFGGSIIIGVPALMILVQFIS